MNQEISDKIIDRAVEIWCRSLHNPKFDNGDKSFNGFMGQSLAQMNIDADKSKIDGMEQRIESFRTELAAAIKSELKERSYVWLDVDYSPCKILADAAEKAGIPHSLFSVKSGVTLNPGHAAASFGYGAEHQNHYPLADGGWLITTLSGSDIAKVIEQVEAGNSMGFTVEPASE